MNQIRKNFQCFRCGCRNSVVVPHYFKGKKCKRCHAFNYFNYIPDYKKRFGNPNNLVNNRRVNTVLTNHDNFRRNQILSDSINNNPFINRNNNTNNNNNDNRKNNLNRISNTLRNRNNNINTNERNNLIQIPNTSNIRNNNINDNRNNINLNQASNTLNNRNNNRIHNNHIENHNMDDVFFFNNNSIFNNSSSLYNNISSNNRRQEENIIIPWLPKQKINEEIKRKYKDEICSICLEKINGDITITKCNHIFHYLCLAKNIKTYEKTECPICRSNVKTGRKKEVANRMVPIRRNIEYDYSYQLSILNSFSNHENHQRNNNFGNNNIRLNGQEANDNNDNRWFLVQLFMDIGNLIKNCV